MFALRSTIWKTNMTLISRCIQKKEVKNNQFMIGNIFNSNVKIISDMALSRMLWKSVKRIWQKRQDRFQFKICSHSSTLKCSNPTTSAMIPQENSSFSNFKERSESNVICISQSLPNFYECKFENDYSLGVCDTNVPVLCTYVLDTIVLCKGCNLQY